MIKSKEKKWQFLQFQPRFGVKPFVNYCVEALLANFPKGKSSHKALILKKNGIFIFSIVIYSFEGIYQSHAEISMIQSQKWSRLWQKNITENLVVNIMKQHHAWKVARKNFFQV